MRRPMFVTRAALLLAIAAGCGRSVDLPEVSGVVTLDGEPVPGAVITFFPEAGGGPPASGATDNEGRYRLMSTRDLSGATPGKHRVEITTERISDSEAEEMRAAGQTVPPASVEIPKKFGVPGALTAEVKPGSNQIDFPLRSQE